MKTPELFYKEKTTHGSQDFPCSFYYADGRNFLPDSPFLCRHHWHDEVEFLYFEKGIFDLEINMEKFHIEEECFCFVGSGELHAITGKPGFSECALVFSPAMLDFAANDSCRLQILQPLAEHRLSLPRIITAEQPCFSAIRQAWQTLLSCFDGAAAVCRSAETRPADDGLAAGTCPTDVSLTTGTRLTNGSLTAGTCLADCRIANGTHPTDDRFTAETCLTESSCTDGTLLTNGSFLTGSDQTVHESGVTEPDYRKNLLDLDVPMISVCDQLGVKASLLAILAALGRDGLLSLTDPHTDQRVPLIKQTISYMNEHFRERIYISDLAALVNMNEQYFCRFFRKSIGKPPIEYLNELRIRHAMRMLRHTDSTVMEISLDCGFNNLGNFMRTFKKQTNTTPLQYRKSIRDRLSS